MQAIFLETAVLTRFSICPFTFPTVCFIPGGRAIIIEKRDGDSIACAVSWPFLCDRYQIMRNEYAPSVFDNLAMCPL